MDKNQINWEEYRKNLVSSLSNERLWALGCNDFSYNPHISNIAELETEIKHIDEEDYDTIISMHKDTSEYFNDFLLEIDIPEQDPVLLQKIAQRFHNLNFINLGNEFCILFQGLIVPLNFDYKRIQKDWNHAEGNFSQWYIHLLPEERERLIEYYTKEHIL